MYYFEIFKSDKNGRYYFRIKAGNNEKVAQSEGYILKSSCEHTVERIKSNITPATPVKDLT